MAISSSLGSSALLPAGLGFRNVLINGDMRINQRGGSYTSVGYTLDRWNMTVTGAYTVSQSTSTPPTGFQNFMRLQRTSGSGNTGVPQIFQSLETSNSIPLQGKQVTVSFYARAGANYSATSNAFNWRIYAGTGTDQAINAYTGQTILFDQSVTLTTSWQRFTYTTTALTSYNEYGLFFFSVPTGTAGADDYFDITGVQLEQNYQPTPFEQRPIGVELALCQRYYCRIVATSAYGTLADGAAGDTINAYFYTIAPVTMRVRPTSVESSNIILGDIVGVFLCNAVVLDTVVSNAHRPAVFIAATTAVLTAAKRYFVLGYNDAAAYLAFSAEL